MISWKAPQTATITSILAIIIAAASLTVSKLSYDLAAAKDEREIREKTPAIDVQVTPAGVASANVTIQVFNRGDINIAPLDITVLPSLQAGEFYFSSQRQSIDKLESSLSLTPVGSISPKNTGIFKATLSGVTDDKHDAFATGVELQFTVRIRLADDQDTIKTFDIIRRVRR